MTFSWKVSSAASLPWCLLMIFLGIPWVCLGGSFNIGARDEKMGALVNGCVVFLDESFGGEVDMLMLSAYGVLRVLLGTRLKQWDWKAWGWKILTGYGFINSTLFLKEKGKHRTRGICISCVVAAGYRRPMFLWGCGETIHPPLLWIFDHIVEACGGIIERENWRRGEIWQQISGWRTFV